jgi:VWFA-related protein
MLRPAAMRSMKTKMKARATAARVRMEAMRTRIAPWIVAGLLALLADVHAQQPPVPAPGPTPTFRTNVDLVSSDVIVRGKNGQFVADLTKDDFDLLEDGVKQELNSFVLVHGGRAYTTMVAAPSVVREGVILPPTRPMNDTAGRIILFIVDDLHLDFGQTPHIRDLFKKLGKELIHEGDLFGVVSTGTSSIAMDLTYDRTRLDEAAKRISGGGLKPKDVIEQSARGETPQEVMHRAHVAFETQLDVIRNLSQTHNRRKAVVVVSNGYDFDPFLASRSGTSMNTRSNNPNVDPNNPAYAEMNRSQKFNDTDLAIELNEIAREANRANATFYTIDPRGLTAGPDIDQEVDPVEWETHVRKQQDSLRSLAEQTGGLAIVNTNDFDKALKRIDAETSDYYVLGYYSSNPDPTQKRRQVEIRIKKPEASGATYELTYRREYQLKPLPTAAKPK